MSDFYFETQQLSVGYDGKPLIENISIGVKKGEIVTLIGPNGAGKSTILKSITRQLKLIGGTVVLDDKALPEISHHELSTKMAVVLTERLNPELMTCRDLVATGRYPYTGRLGLLSEHDEQMVYEAMKSVHVLELAEKDFSAISDGQRQRLLLARALCQEPEIIILDEPTSFLDIRHKVELLTLLRTMAEQNGITIIMSLHEIDLAQKISDKILCVKGDHVFHYGPPEDVFQEETIRALYEIELGSFDPLFGSIELAPPQGEPTVLVLSSCGSGIPVYRQLQKAGTPFIAAIVYTNDVDYVLARHLAARVITEQPFCPVSDAAFAQARQAVESCERVIDAGISFGEANSRLKDLLELAESLGKLEKRG